MSLFFNIFRNSSEAYLKLKQPILKLINEKEKEIEKLERDTFVKRIKEIREEIKNEKDLDKYLVEVFALTREASKRTLNQRHFDV